MNVVASVLEIGGAVLVVAAVAALAGGWWAALLAGAVSTGVGVLLDRS